MIDTPDRNQPSERDIASLADGSLAPERRERVERAVAESPELQAELRDQRYALDAVRAVSAERAPADLRARVASARPARRPARRRFGALAAAGVAAAAAAIALTLGGGAEGPSAADAAVLGARPPAAAVPAVNHGATLASPRAAGLRFPYWRDHFGWRAVGSRADRIDGRAATTVFYRHRNQTVAYTIVGGAPLRAGASTTRSLRDGTRLQSLTSHGRHAVTWLRGGHTCVRSGTTTRAATLLSLAAWRGGGDIAF
jgi:hypothetical protein